MPRIRAENIAAHKEKTRRQILDAARQNFLEFGYPETSLGDIALDADIGRTTLYEYFPDKEAVLIELVNEEMPTIVDSILAGIPQGLTSKEHLGEVIVRHLDFIADESNLGTMIMRDTNKLSGEAQMAIRRAHKRLEDEIVEVYRTGAAAGEFRPIEPSLAGELVNAVTMYGARKLLRSPDPKAQIHETADVVLDFLFSGLGAA